MNFASDNTGPAHPDVMAALMRANEGYAQPYGHDDWMPGVIARIREIFEAPEAEVFLVATGTAANSLALACLVEPWQAIFASAPQVSSIEQLARNLCQSRRTLGRFFNDRQLPVPSHWLQFARLLHVAVHLQNTSATINRVSSRFGYPDGFTMSNSMKRLTGYRPSFVRDHLGWEWLIHAWLREEGLA